MFDISSLTEITTFNYTNVILLQELYSIDDTRVILTLDSNNNLIWFTQGGEDVDPSTEWQQVLIMNQTFDQTQLPTFAYLNQEPFAGYPYGVLISPSNFV